jgi:hypothetical protein
MYDLHPTSEYKDWFHTKEPGKSYFPAGTDYNTWWAKPFEYRADYHSTGWTGMRTKYFIENYNFDDKPLFLKSSFFAPHSPYDCPQKYVDMVDESKMAPIVKGAAWDKKYQNASNPECCGT